MFRRPPDQFFSTEYTAWAPRAAEKSATGPRTAVRVNGVTRTMRRSAVQRSLRTIAQTPRVRSTAPGVREACKTGGATGLALVSLVDGVAGSIGVSVALPSVPSQKSEQRTLPLARRER